MRTIAIGAIAIALLAAACASPTSVDADSVQEAASPVVTAPVTTVPVAASPITTSPVTTSPVAISPPTTSGIELSDGLVSPSGDLDVESELVEVEPTVTTQPPKESPAVPIQPVEPHASGPAAAAVADLATRLGIDESSVTLVSQNEVTWPDGSLGCPQPGMGYTQALVSGSLILLEAGGLRYEYHSGGGGQPFYCAFPTPPTTGEHGDI